MPMNEGRLCLDCHQPLVGRADKKFCDDACRSNYNNRLIAEQTVYVRAVNATLKKNRKILEKLNPDGKIKVKRKTLLREGFSFDYFTGIYETGKGSQYRFCYEYGYLLLDNDDVLLVKRSEPAS